ncbi:MAG: GTP pyrophosphokinase family protein [Bacteroidales bacterium]|jgi:putative GTP pyrophosphokinase|nr:GTP pyrophosphokinase family protein [Bacteroidales bacterium]
MEISDFRASYLFDGITGEQLPEEMIKAMRSFISAENLYVSAAREIVTKFENLNSEFKYTYERNPIHSINARAKTPASIVRKLQRNGLQLTVDSARKHLTDLAGVRVICSYVDDIYRVKDMLLSQDDVTLVRMSDYIKNPKPNGYRSLHLIVTVPVFQATKTEIVAVEIQIRTIAMDFWASLEHELAYKLEEKDRKSASKELKACADEIASLDIKMQNLYNISISETESGIAPNKNR